MRLRILTPAETVLDAQVQKIDVEAADGFFTLLPRHTDFINALKPGICTITLSDGQKHYAACNEGVIIKIGPDIAISTRLAVLSDNETELIQTIKTDFKRMREERREISAALARLEIGLAKGFMTLSEETKEASYGGI